MFILEDCDHFLKVAAVIFQMSESRGQNVRVICYNVQLKGCFFFFFYLVMQRLQWLGGMKRKCQNCQKEKQLDSTCKLLPALVVGIVGEKAPIILLLSLFQ